VPGTLSFSIVPVGYFVRVEFFLFFHGIVY